MAGRSAGRRGFLKLASAATLLSVAGHAAEAAMRGMPAIPAPSGFEERGPIDPLWTREADRVAAEGFEPIAFFASADIRPFTWTVFRPAEPEDDDAAGFQAALETLRARLPTRIGPPDGAHAFESFADLRFERQVVADDAFFWLGSWSGRVDGEAGLVVEGLLWLDGRTLRFRGQGALQAGETPVPAGPRPADGGVAISESPGGGVTFSIAKPLSPLERRSLAADAGRAWVVLDGWVDAVRVANGLPALTVHDIAGVAVTIPAPDGFIRRLIDPEVGPLDARYPDVDFVAAGESMGRADRTSIWVSPRGRIGVPAVTRPQFDALLRDLQEVAAWAPVFGGLAGVGEINERVGTAESPDSFTMLFLRREAPEQGGSGIAYLDGQAHIWVSGLALAVLMTSRAMAESDAAILRAWDIFRDWAAAVVAANGGR